MRRKTRTNRLQYFTGFVYIEPFNAVEGFWVFPKEGALFEIESQRVAKESDEEPADYDDMDSTWLM